MRVYQVPEGYESFEAVEKVFREKLPEKFKIVEAKAGGKMPMFTAGKKVGTIKIRQNSYNGMEISLTSTDGVKNDYITIVDYVPSYIVQFLRGQVLGSVTNLIFPAIYGTSTKIYDTVDEIIMNNFKTHLMDTSMKASLKSMVAGKALDQIKKSSVVSDAEDTVDNAIDDVKSSVTDSIKDKLGF